MGDSQYRSGYHDAHGGMWGILSTVVDIMMHMGGYREYRGGVQYRGGDIIFRNAI